jgi:oligopeptide/dipeptide ABC transporter ATP-binding protein
VLDVRDLKTYFFTYEGVVRALDGINLTVRGGETTGIVGETGCGKSVTAFSIDRLVADPGRVVSGTVVFRGANLLWGLEREARFKRIRGSDRVKILRKFRRIREANERMSAVRGAGIAMIFQEPMQAMNPVFSISNQLGEAILIHRGLEIVDSLLAADRLARTERGFSNLFAEERRDRRLAANRPLDSRSMFDEKPSESASPLPSEAAPVDKPPVTPIDTLLAAVGAPPDELRRACVRFAETLQLPTLGTELFHTLQHRDPAKDHRRAVLRVLRRTKLGSVQRSYLRHRRRLFQLQQRLNETYLKEMTEGKPLRARRGAIRSQMTLSNLRHFYFSVWGLRGRAQSALNKDLFWRTVELLEGVRIANPVQVARGFPHELSGGMLQRVMIAMALSCNPALLLADEPTTALDVTIQAQILELMRDLKVRVGTGIVLITHDLGVVAEVCDWVNVMYAGLIVESASVTELFRRPLHPYSQGLLAAIPRFDRPEKELGSIPGSVPTLLRPPPGCRFYPRCAYAMPVCKEVRPPEFRVDAEHMVACHLYSSAEAEGEPATTVAPPEPPAPADVAEPSLPSEGVASASLTPSI